MYAQSGKSFCPTEDDVDEQIDETAEEEEPLDL